jgi:uncharacterized protein
LDPNFLISLATLVSSAAARVEFLGAADVSSLGVEILSMLIGGMVAAWIGAGFLKRIPKAHIMNVIALLLAATAGLLATEALLSGVSWSAIPQDAALRAVVGVAAGLSLAQSAACLG